ncbi:PilN domain-containing protein [Parashewanella tropica]|uniref:PilN domain-containing protein n=1 Tax=Parashewanella tropica TaxID=2547970 RepID=UPI00105A0C66|nr:PilN domain-containing protein [Parashewanella tropica]
MTVKTRVNLLSEDLLPKRLKLSLPRLLSAFAVILSLSVGLSVILWAKDDALSAKMQLLQNQSQQIQAQQKQLEQQLALHQPDQALAQEIELKRKQLDIKHKMIAELNNDSKLQSRSFDAMLEDLARVADGSSWLTDIEVHEGKLKLSGETLSAQSVPAWIQRLSQTHSFAGQKFSDLQLQRDEKGVIHFHLSTDFSKAPSATTAVAEGNQ